MFFLTSVAFYGFYRPVFVVSLACATISLTQASSVAEIIPASRRIDWSVGKTVGVPGGIPNRTTIGKNAVTDYNADPTGARDSTAAIQNAINNAGTEQVVYIPAGSYKISGNITPRSNVTLRGAGMGLTILKPQGGGGNGTLQNSGDWPVPSPTITIMSGATKGSTSVTVTKSSGVAVHKLITISSIREPYMWHMGSSYGDGPSYNGLDKTRLLNSTHYVTSIRGNTINFTPPLPIDMANTPKITPWKSIILVGFGIEDITFDMKDSDAIAPIFLAQPYSCWIRGVEVANTRSRQMWFYQMVNCEIRECYVHDTIGTGPNHEGIDLALECCFNLIENNICINGGKPAIQLGDWGGGCNGNVIGYNYIHNANIGSAPVEYSISVNHGPHNLMNLVEGNVGQGVTSDGYFGSSSHNSFFRNYLSGDYPSNVDWPIAVQMCKWSYYTNFAGNVLGKSGAGQIYQASGSNYPNTVKVVWELGYPNTGNTWYSKTYTGAPTNPGNTDPTDKLDSAVEGSMIRHGNFDYVTNKTTWDPSIEDHNLPSSLYLSGRPAWWGSSPWPPIGPDVKPMRGQIPAEIRFLTLGTSQRSTPQIAIPGSPRSVEKDKKAKKKKWWKWGKAKELGERDD
jgi:hypothetical protein